jgi:hypothetical protein
MAIIKVNREYSQIPAIYEDPRPSGNRIYFWGQAFEKDTLDYVVNGGIVYAAGGIGAWGFPSYAASNAWRYNGIMFLSGEVVHCMHYGVGNNLRENNVDMTGFMSMDPANPCRNHRYISSNGNEVIYSNYASLRNNNDAGQAIARVNHTGELDNNFPAKIVSGTYYHSWPIWFNQSTGNLVQVFHYFNNANEQVWPYYLGFGRATNVARPGLGIAWEHPATYDNYFTQMIGINSGNTAIFLSNDVATDHTQVIRRYDDSTNVSTTLSTFNTAPAAAGTSAGGNRAATFGNTFPKLSSRTFTDPNTATVKGWYTPYFDVNGKYHPFYFQWNTTTDTFTRNADITVNWGATDQNSQWLPDAVSAASSGSGHIMQRFVYNETFTLGGTRYLTMYQLHGGTNIYDSEAKYRTFVTFSVNASNPKSLTYHSRVIAPASPKNIIWLNEEHTIMGIFGHTSFWIYSFNASTGWVLTSTQPFKVEAAGTDSLGRLWLVDGGPYNYGRIHLVSPSVPVEVSVVLDQNALNYQGVDVDLNAIVNAYNVSGQRIVSEVTLLIEGSSLRIINDSNEEISQVTVTTSASADTTVSMRVIAAGTSNIITTVNI